MSANARDPVTGRFQRVGRGSDKVPAATYLSQDAAKYIEENYKRSRSALIADLITEAIANRREASLDGCREVLEPVRYTEAPTRARDTAQGGFGEAPQRGRYSSMADHSVSTNPGEHRLEALELAHESVVCSPERALSIVEGARVVSRLAMEWEEFDPAFEQPEWLDDAVYETERLYAKKEFKNLKANLGRWERLASDLRIISFFMEIWGEVERAWALFPQMIEGWDWTEKPMFVSLPPPETPGAYKDEWIWFDSEGLLADYAEMDRWKDKFLDDPWGMTLDLSPFGGSPAKDGLNSYAKFSAISLLSRGRVSLRA